MPDKKQVSKVESEHPMISVPDAIRMILTETAKHLVTNPSGQTETKAIEDAINEVLEKAVLMPEPGYPPYCASIMDGYCIRTSQTFTPGDKWTHYVVDKVYAGDEREYIHDESTPGKELPLAFYVTTGAKVPDSFDCVIPVEDVLVDPDAGRGDGDVQRIAILKMPPKIGQWIRPVGCDMPPESVVLPSGHVVDSISLGLLKQCGMTHIQVRKKVRVGILSTGNELVLGKWDLQADGRQGKIPDVNRPVLCQMLQQLGLCHVVDLGVCRDDDPTAMTDAIQSALDTCEVILTTGGISMGETDIVENVLVQNLGGTLHFGRLHMKPGKPSTFVTIPVGSKSRFVFALPGNPVSAFVCSHLLVRPCLQLLYEGLDASVDTHGISVDQTVLHIADNTTLTPPEIMALLAHDIPLDSERPEYHRVRLKFQPERNAWLATSTGNQRSSCLMSLRDADALLALPQGLSNRPIALAGESFPALLLKEHFVPKSTFSKSRHLDKKCVRSFLVDIIVIGKATLVEDINARVKHALEGSRSGSIVISSEREYLGAIEGLYDFVTEGSEADLHVVIGANHKGSFATNTAAARHLEKRLLKVADAMALQMRRAAAVQSPYAALFETIVGLVRDRPGALLLFVSPHGLEGGLSNVRSLIKHAIETSRGNNHAHRQPVNQVKSNQTKSLLSKIC